MRIAWGAGDTFNDYAQQLLAIVYELGEGRFKVDYLKAGAMVKTFEVRTRSASARSTPAIRFRFTGTARTAPPSCSARALLGLA